MTNEAKNAELVAEAANTLIHSKGETFKDKFFRLCLNIILEEKKGKWYLSVGRVSWWMAFIPALQIWIGGGDIKEHHLTILLVLAGYNLGKKIVNKVRQTSESE